MKKMVALMALSILFAGQSFALDEAAELNEKLSVIGFGKLFSLEPKTQIEKIMSNHLKYSNRHNLKKLRSYYDDRYVNADGFDVNTYFKLVEEAWKSYPDIEYSSEIKNITVNGDFAIVQTIDSAKGIAKEISEYLGDKGLLESSSEIIYYLKKSGNTWVIVSDEAIREKTYMKYGEAKDIAFDIIAPPVAMAGQEYSVLFAVDVPKDNIVLGSITNEKITFPSERPKEVFRKLKNDGILERFVRANNDGFNEQAVVSVGITKAEMGENMDMQLSVSGVAFLMSRVNVVKAKKFDISGITSEKESEL